MNLLNNRHDEFNPNINKEIIKGFLDEYKNNYDVSLDEQAWFNKVKEIAIKYNFCADNKIYKEDPTIWNGNINDACEIIRIALTTRKVTQNLFSIMKILSKEEISFRFNKIIASL